LDGYLAEVYLVSGTILNPTDFGQTDTNSAQWIPKAYSAGSYSINGFYLKFADNSNTTAATLGKDSSGQGNNWTPSGFQSYDQVVDSPTNNFCALTSLSPAGFGGAAGKGVLSSGNLIGGGNGTAYYNPSSIYVSSGAWYFEATIVAKINTTDTMGVGIVDPTGGILRYLRSRSTDCAVNLGSGDTGGYTQWSAGDVIGIAFDLGANSFYIYRQGALVASSTSAGVSGTTWSPYIYMGSTSPYGTISFNFGQGGQAGLTYDAPSGGRFKYTPPAGFKALCTANLPAPMIKMPSQYMAVATWTGTGASNAINLGMQPDLAWFKCRSNVAQHGWIDSVRGVSAQLSSSNAGGDNTIGDIVTGFNSSGVTLGADANGFDNYSGRTFVGWFWKKGSTPGFDIQNAVAGSTSTAWNHALGTSPAFVIIKDRGASSNWCVYHQALGSNYFLRLNTADSQISNAGMYSASPGAFTLTGSAIAGDNNIAYLWAEVPGFSRFGSYTGNGSADGSFVYCGFKPRFILFKSTNNSGSWQVWDSARNPINTGGNFLTLFPNLTSADTSSEIIDVVSNGFKMRTSNMNLNYSGYNYIFAAFAEAPFKYANAK
jgi:hypothetical protein